MNLRRDPRVEQKLNNEGVLWHYEEDILLEKKVNREASLKNQARFKAINQDHVIELAISAEHAELPALTGYYGKDGRIVIISGNHRMEALLLAGKTKHDFYIVDTVHPSVIDRLTRTGNEIEGDPLPKEERIQNATYMVKRYGLSELQAAKMFRLTSSSVNSAVVAEEVRERLARLGFPERVSTGCLISLHKIKQDTPLLETAKLIHEAQLTGDETKEASRRIQRASSSEKNQLAELAKIKNDYRPRIAKLQRGQLRRVIIPVIELRKSVNRINSIRPDAVKPLDADLKKRVGWAISKLEEISQNGQQI